MKKLLAIALSAILLFGMAGCGGNSAQTASAPAAATPAPTPVPTPEQSALEIYNAASKKLTDADSFSGKAEIKTTMLSGGETIDSDVAMDFVQVNAPGGKIEMKMNSKTKTLGQEIDLNAYYRDGIYYTDAMGTTMQMEMDIEEVKSQVNSGVLTIPDSAVKEQSAKDAHGGKEIAMTLDGKMIIEAGGVVSGMSRQFGDMLDSVNMGDIKLTALIDGDGNMKKYGIDYSLVVRIGEEDVSSSATMTMDITQIGGLTIEYPEAIDAYEKIDLSGLGMLDADIPVISPEIGSVEEWGSAQLQSLTIRYPKEAEPTVTLDSFTLMLNLELQSMVTLESTEADGETLGEKLKNGGFEAELARMQEEMPEEMSNFKAEEVDFLGGKAIDFSFDVDFGGALGKGRTLSFSDSKNDYYVMFISAQEAFEDYLPLFEKMLEEMTMDDRN